MSTTEDAMKIAMTASERIAHFQNSTTDEAAPADFRRIAQSALAELAHDRTAQLADPDLSPEEQRPAFILDQWTAAYSAFKGAFDTSLSRRKHDDEFCTDARKRLHDFDEAIRAAEQTGAIPLDLRHGSLLQWAEVNLSHEHSVTKALTNYVHEENPHRRPDTSQEWARLDGGMAFSLIARHAEN